MADDDGVNEGVKHSDDLRERGEVTWEEYAQLLKGKLSSFSLRDFVTGKRDRQGRLRRLKDLGGR